MFKIGSIGVINYKIQTNCKITFPPLSIDSKERVYSFKVDIIATPFETLDSFKQLVDKAVNVRLYDRIYAIFQNEKSYRESFEIEQQVKQRVGQDSRTAHRLDKNLLLTPQEAKFFKSLPGWAQALATYVSVFQPGLYHDSYEMYIVPLPDDTYHAPDDTLIFRGYNADEVRRKLNNYKETFKIENDF